MADNYEARESPLWSKLVNNRYPISLDFEVTARCNYKCRHCYINLPAHDGIAKKKELTLSEIESIASRIYKMGTVNWLITGGEPLLRPDFPQIYSMLKRKGFLVSVFTNGSLISERIVKLFKAYPPRDIEITVYGATRETYESVTQTDGSYDRFLNGLSLLAEADIPVRLKAMIVKSNLHEHELIRTFCQKRGKDYYRFGVNLHARIDGDKNRNEMIRSERLSPEEVITVENADEKLMKVLVSEMKKFNQKDNMADNILPKREASVFCCTPGKRNFSISYDGYLRICDLNLEGTTIKLSEDTCVIDAWQTIRGKLMKITSTRKEFLDNCYSCKIIDFCQWCPSRSLLETGELDRHIPFFCKVAHLRFENIRKRLTP